MTYDRTLILIRERSFLDLLDLALLVVRDRPVALGLTALAGIAPGPRSISGCSPTPTFRPCFWLVLLLLETPWATAPLTLVLGDLMFGVPPAPRDPRRACSSRCRRWSSPSSWCADCCL